ncbi:MAG TPA: serine protease [Rhodopila sp.]
MRFVLKTSLANRVPLSIGDRLVLDCYAQLRDTVAAWAGTEAARLFAEPVLTPGRAGAPGSISWYTDAEDEARALRDLPPDERVPLERALGKILARLLPRCSDPEHGPLITSALALADPAGVLAVGGRVVLVEWGMLPAGVSAEANGIANQFAATLGRYIEPVPAAAPARVAAERPSAQAPAPLITSSPVMPARSEASAYNRWLIPAAIVVAAAFLGLGTWLGARAIERQFAARAGTASIADADAIRDAVARRQAENAALEAQIEATRRSLAGNVCVVDAGRLPASVPPDTPIVPAMRPPAPPGTAQFQGTLIDLLRQATVLILVPHEHGLVLGSGFFIGPQTVVTNRHVVQEAGSDGILVVNKLLGRPMRATVRTMTPNADIYQPDIAVLSVADAPAVQPLSFTRTAGQLDTVIAAGFPGVLLDADTAFSHLLHGDLSAMPSVILTDGRINAVQTAPSGLPILPHSAQISAGNSGGPLVDACGRVVGINTFINVAADQAVHINYAEKADAVLDFLHASRVDATEQTAPCQPGVPAQSPSAAAQPAPTAPTSPPPTAVSP